MSGFLKLNLADLGKSLIVAFFSAFITALYALFQAGSFPTWQQIVTCAGVGVAGAIGYLVKNVLSNNQGEILAKDVEPPPAIKP